jgi:integrase/recombinase XerD
MPKRTKGILQVPTEAEMKRLLAQPNVLRPIGLRDRALFEVAYGCGLRRGELERLTIFDPDLQQGTLRVLGKGRKERIVPLGSQAVHWLRKYLKHSRRKLLKGKVDLEALWISTQARALGGFAIRQQLYVYVKKAKIETPMNLHSLRKACVTHMLAHGAHPVQIQMLLGHADLRHLSQYLNVTITDLKQAHKRTRPGK